MILQISNTLSKKISTKCAKIKTYPQKEIDKYWKIDEDFFNIIDKAQIVLKKNLFVIIKNIGFVREKNIFESFVKQFGKFYGEVEYTDIKLECFYTGCNYNQIELHNDDAIDLNRQPKYGFIQVLNEDPLKIAKNYIVKIDDIVEYLEIYNKELLEKLFTYKVPMLSYGINYLGSLKEEIIVNEPILYKINTQINVRFDTTRIRHYYWKKKLKQPIEEKKLIYDFLTIAKKLQKELYLEKGDILIHNNLRTLHDRGNCSIELLENGEFNTREIFVSFAR
jgi:hypothetical protein